MKRIAIVIFVFFLYGCSSTPLMNLARESKCITEVAKESKFTCEFEGKKVFAKK